MLFPRFYVGCVVAAACLCFTFTLVSAVPVRTTNINEDSQLSSQEMEKWLEEFTQYLEQYNRMSSNEVGLHQPHGYPARNIRQKLIPKTSSAGGMPEQPEWWSKDPARKRNAELINNLLGLPRMMKVVG